MSKLGPLNTVTFAKQNGKLLCSRCRGRGKKVTHTLPGSGLMSCQCDNASCNCGSPWAVRARRVANGC